ncbi:MAG: hypothetical protein JWM52_399 [Candidatus Saccharibacteria bacterium]|nr:hypothetical protein [Candidatus Saccharibacteria bacterium]
MSRTGILNSGERDARRGSGFGGFVTLGNGDLLLPDLIKDVLDETCDQWPEFLEETHGEPLDEKPEDKSYQEDNDHWANPHEQHQ